MESDANAVTKTEAKPAAKLVIVGTGAMGKILRELAEKDGAFGEIAMAEPVSENPYPKWKADLLIDFSHPKAILGIYEYCRSFGGGIPVVLATTGYGDEEEEIIKLLGKICKVERSSNFSQGISAVNELVKLAAKLLGDKADIRLFESHHTLKKDAPSGTCKTLCQCAGVSPSEYGEKVAFLRMGNLCGEHSVYFAMEDELIEIRHIAYSKKIFASGALSAGKKMIACKRVAKTAR